jgi:hypothetical protein
MLCDFLSKCLTRETKAESALRVDLEAVKSLESEYLSNFLDWKAFDTAFYDDRMNEDVHVEYIRRVQELRESQTSRLDFGTKSNSVVDSAIRDLWSCSYTLQPRGSLYDEYLLSEYSEQSMSPSMWIARKWLNEEGIFAIPTYVRSSPLIYTKDLNHRLIDLSTRVIPKIYAELSSFSSVPPSTEFPLRIIIATTCSMDDHSKVIPTIKAAFPDMQYHTIEYHEACSFPTPSAPNYGCIMSGVPAFMVDKYTESDLVIVVNPRRDMKKFIAGMRDRFILKESKKVIQVVDKPKSYAELTVPSLELWKERFGTTFAWTPNDRVFEWGDFGTQLERKKISSVWQQMMESRSEIFSRQIAAREYTRDLSNEDAMVLLNSWNTERHFHESRLSNLFSETPLDETNVKNACREYTQKILTLLTQFIDEPNECVLNESERIASVQFGKLFQYA